MEQVQYISDGEGKKLAVILPIEKYTKILADLEELEDLRLYDEAKAKDDSEGILLEDYLKKRNIHLE